MPTTTYRIKNHSSSTLRFAPLQINCVGIANAGHLENFF
jgi:hypothetical protein